MKRKSLISLLLVAVMTALCVLGLVLNAAAEENLVLYAVGELEIEGAIHVESIQDALADLEKNSRKWSADTTAEIRITGSSHTGGAQDGVLFGQVTIWRADGTKLPIKILGVDTAEERDTYIYLDSAGGWYACANDYTFENLTLPVGDQETFFFAGSGDVRFVNCDLTSGGDLTIENVADRTAMYQNARAAAISVCTDEDDLIVPDVGRLPCGDAWQKVRHSEEYHATGTVLTDENGEKYVDKDLTGKSGTAYGDYGHAGNTGGGQYLNACVYYEAILGLECKDNPWRPTAYELDETLVPILQKAAHDAVVEVYGEDHFKNPVDADIDDNGVINLLMMGSSSSYYMRDELHLMARHIGIDLRVVHAYSSGIKMSTQWSWANNGTGKWTVYTEWDGKTSSGVENQKLSDYVSDYPWDVIVTYETGGSFNKKKLGVSGYSDASVAKAIASCEKADEFINFVYSYNNNSNANARYFWFQSVAAPVGAPGPNDDAKGYLYGDNCTSAVYAGWTAEDIARYTESGKLAASSITLGEGADYGTLISSVGYISTAPETPLTDETAKEVKFLDCSGYEAYTAPEVLPVNTVGKIVVDGATIGAPEVHIGYSPASAILHVKAGYSGSITTCNKNSNPRYGDVSVKLTGGTIEQLDTLYNGHIVGNLSFFMDDIDGEVAVAGMIRTCFSTNSVSGDVTVDVRAGTIGGSVYPGGEAGGTVYNNLSNCAIAANFYGIRSGAAKRVVNNVCGVTVGGNFYGGHYTTNALEVVENHIDGLVVDGVFCGGTYSDKTSPKITGGKVMIDGKEDTLAIYNDIKNLTANGDFYGASQGGTVGAVRNDIRNITVKGVFYGGAQGSATKVASVTNNVQGGTFEGAFRGSGLGVEGDITNKISGSPTFTGVFYGSYSKLTVGNVVTEVSGTPTFSNTFNAMGYDKDSDGSEGKTLTTTIKGGTFNGSIYMSGQILRNRTSNITIDGGTFAGTIYCSGYEGTAKEVNLTVKSGTFNNYFYGGMYNSTTSINPIAINLTIEGGTFNGTFFGGSRGVKTGDVHVIVRGNPVFNKSFVPGGWNKLAGSLTTADIVTGNITLEIYGGTFNSIYCGSSHGTVASVTTTVDGATVNGLFHGAYGGTMGDVVTNIKSGTFGGKVLLGPWGGSCASITNNISGGTFNDSTATIIVNEKEKTLSFNTFNGGGPKAIVGDITNNITGGTFNVPVLLGSTGTVGGSVINNISGGTFNKTSCGAGKGKISGNVENTISGTAYFKQGFYAGYSLKDTNTITGNIINKVEQGPETNRPYFGRAPEYFVSKDGTIDSYYNMANSDFGFMGGNYQGKTNGYIQNDISGGYFYGHWHGGGNDDSVNGKNENGDSIINTITGGTFAFRVYGGIVSTPVMAGNIKNEIGGGTFKYEFAAGHRAGTNSLTSTSFSQDINTRIYGNPVFEKKVYGVARGWNVDQAARIRLIADVVLTIEGGTFEEGINGLCNYGEYYDATRPGARIDEGGSLTVNINGGTFKGNIFATSTNFDPALYDETGLATVNIAPTKGDVTILTEVGSRFANEIFNLQGGAYKVLLGADAKIDANAATGDVKLGQASAWKKQTYVTMPEGNEANVTVTGPHCFDRVGNSVVAVKGGIQLSAATMILTDRVAVRALFDQASVDQIDDFTFTFKMGDAVLAEGTKENLEAYGDAYYGIVLAKIGANDFTSNVSFAGSDLVWDYTFSIKTLAVLAEDAWSDNDKGVALAKAMQNFATIVADPTAELPHTLAPDMSLVEGFEATGTINEDANFKVTGKGLVMGNAVGIRIYGTAAEAVSAENLTITVNGTDVTSKAIFGNGNGENAYTIDLYVNAKNMSDKLEIIIKDANGTLCLKLVDRVDTIAASYPETNENYNVVQQLLVYIQAAVAYASANA